MECDIATWLLDGEGRRRSEYGEAVEVDGEALGRVSRGVQEAHHNHHKRRGAVRAAPACSAGRRNRGRRGHGVRGGRHASLILAVGSRARRPVSPMQAAPSPSRLL
jgi:hypothetical protein